MLIVVNIRVIGDAAAGDLSRDDVMFTVLDFT